MNTKSLLKFGITVLAFTYAKPAIAGCQDLVFQPPSNVRYAPSINAGVKGEISYRTSVGVVDKSGEWYKINYPIKGWIHESQITKDCWDDNDYPNQSEYESDYDRFVRIGDEMYERGDFQSALINYRRALRDRPGDNYALNAIRIVQRSIGERGY